MTPKEIIDCWDKNSFDIPWENLAMNLLTVVVTAYYEKDKDFYNKFNPESFEISNLIQLYKDSNKSNKSALNGYFAYLPGTQYISAGQYDINSKTISKHLKIIAVLDIYFNNFYKVRDIFNEKLHMKRSIKEKTSENNTVLKI